MANIETGGDGGGGKNKPKKIQLRVDFTPMVDMNMLLITFFMFVTTLSKPQIMNLVVPSKDDKEILDDKPQTAESRTTTIILAENNIIYYYFGKPDYEDPLALHKTDYSPEGLRAVLVEKNARIVRQVAEWRQQKARGEISEQAFEDAMREIRKDKEGQVVIIKPTDASTYMNLVDVLDEMQITSIGTYAIVELADGDLFMIENFLKNNPDSAQASALNVR